ncbi:hypothetical protein [Brevundimonas sp.]|uniref:hypothetical protein n=1 Tax=Brevundimonas sp. TaxID=1871086 RepID=UPI0025C087F3|nr:hypothetical protein [Brevundimonas sp.]
MIRRLAVSTAAVLFCVAGCSDRADKPETSSDAALNAPTAAPAASDMTTQPETGSGVAAAPSAATVTPALPGAPAYAALYPGAELDGRPAIGAGDAGAGGLVTFRTSASPDEIVAFYKERAEAAGMRSVMGLNQGDARAYGAAGEANDGPRLQVVAAPGDGGATSVQLTWSEGQ